MIEVQVKYVDQLMNTPSVHAVGIGLVHKDGELSEDLAIIVTVDINRPADQRDVIDKIPRVLDGCPVQVQERGRLRETGLSTLSIVPLMEVCRGGGGGDRTV